jgi:hypothetical protein
MPFNRPRGGSAGDCFVRAGRGASTETQIIPGAQTGLQKTSGMIDHIVQRTL